MLYLPPLITFTILLTSLHACWYAWSRACLCRSSLQGPALRLPLLQYGVPAFHGEYVLPAVFGNDLCNFQCLPVVVAHHHGESARLGLYAFLEDHGKRNRLLFAPPFLTRIDD